MNYNNNHKLYATNSTVTTTSLATISNFPSFFNDDIENPATSNSQLLIKVIIACVSLLVIVLTAGGNLLVLYAWFIDKKLRTTNNYFLISLAIADSIIGLISMPLSTLYMITDSWIMGPYVCDLYLSLDYTVSNASVANLILISFDRYFSITRPLTYRVNRTTRKVKIFIAFSWLVSILIWVPFIIAWPYIHGSRILKDDECKVQFLYTNKFLTLLTSFLAFYLPVVVIITLYYKIWLATKKRNVELKSLQGANKESTKHIKTNKNDINSSTKRLVNNDSIRNEKKKYPNKDKSVTITDDQSTTDKLSYIKSSSFADFNNIKNEAKKKVKKGRKRPSNAFLNSKTNKSYRLKKFLSYIVDKEDENEYNNEENDNSSYSADSNDPTTTNNDQQQSNHLLSPQLSSSTLTINKKSSIKEPKPTKEVTTYSQFTSDVSKKYKIYYKSKPHRHHSEFGHPVTAKPNEPCCKYCQNHTEQKVNNPNNEDPSFYTIVIKLNEFKDNFEKLNGNAQQQGHKQNLQIKQYPLTSFRKNSKMNVNDFENAYYDCCKNCRNKLLFLSRSSNEIYSNTKLNDMSNTQKNNDNNNKNLSILKSNSYNLLYPANLNEYPLDNMSNLRTNINDKNSIKTTSNTQKQIVDNKKIEASTNLTKTSINNMKSKGKQVSIKTNPKKFEKKNDQKAAKTLSAILLAFIITWTPYNINVVVNTFCDNCLDQYQNWQFFAYWLCYMNSTINPVLYALCNANFRRTFKDILLCKKRSTSKK